MPRQDTHTDDKARLRRTELFLILDLVVLWLMLAMLATGLVVRYVLPPGSGGHGGGHGLLLWGLDRHGWGGLHFWVSLLLLVFLLLHVALHWTWICGVVRRRMGHPGAAVTYGRLLRWGALTLAGTAVMVGGFVALSQASVTQSSQPHALVARTVAPRTEVAERTRDLLRAPAPALAPRCDERRGELCAVDSPPAQVSTSVKHLPARRRGRGRLPTEHGEVAHGEESVRGHMTLAQVARSSGMTLQQLRAALGLPDTVSGDERLGRLRRSHGLSIEAVRRAVARP